MRPLLKDAAILLLLVAVAWMSAGCGKSSKAPSTKLQTELLPVPGNPLVSLRVVLRVGSADDPAGKEGLAQLALSCLAQGGSQAMSYREIQEKFYPMAAGLGLGVDKEMSAFTGTVHVDNLDAWYGIVRDMILRPGFREEDFNRVKAAQREFVEKTLVNNMDEQFGKEILNLALYPNHPYGHSEVGTVATVQSISLDDVKAFVKEHFLQGNVIVGIAGGYPADFPGRVQADFGALPEGATPPVALPAPVPPKGLEFVIADKQTPATAISMGFPVDVTRADKDFFALWVAGAHFGEHRQHLSLLFQKIREQRGQNYGDYAYIEYFSQGRDKFPDVNYDRRQQYFSIWIRPLANSNRHFVVRQALRELRKLVEEGIPQDRFEIARTYLVNYTKLYAQTLDERIGWQIDSKYYGYADFLAEAQKVLPTLKKADVDAAIRKHLNFENVRIAVVTQDAEGFRDALSADTPSPISYANPNMPKEVLDEDQVIQTYPLGVKAENVRVAPAAEFFKTPGLPTASEPVTNPAAAPAATPDKER